LTEAIRRRPYSVVLFDEIEKAHQDVFNVMLQVLDEGRLTDGQGRTVDFRNTVLIMTSNVGSEWASGAAEDYEQMRTSMLDELRKRFRPEFLNRIDEMIVFRPLTFEDIEKIVDLQIANLKKTLSENEINLEITDAARDVLARAGFDPVYGARPLKRAVQRLVENPLSKRIIEGGFSKRDTVVISAKGNELVFKKKQ
jgi:ATP-dependent Clp protease ATP-binding subunit ClpB